MGEGNVNIAIEAGADAEVTPYSMHVSSKYLDLTKKKLELTRLPRELELPEERRWDLGTPKAVLEPLLDYWLEHYDWRAQETHLNTSLPQYRTTINLPSTDDEKTVQPLRIHFVHKPSSHRHAIPLLFCHNWPSSFIEVQKIIDALTDPQSLRSFGDGAQQAFHVVAPSIPGFGFSDASSSETFGLKETAEAFSKLMNRLGYDRYVAHGTGWGFNICRTLALNHPQSCISVHTANPTFDQPKFQQSPVPFLKYQVAKVTKASVTSLSFGYVPSEVQEGSGRDTANRSLSKGLEKLRGPLGPTLSHLYSYRPQTLAFSLCDSPIGLLAGLLDVIHTTQMPPSLEPVTSRSRSPFLSPIELEQQDSQHDRASVETTFRDAVPAQGVEQPSEPRESEANSGVYSWSATEVLNWTMMQWLPGPEASLRWLRRTQLDTTPTSPYSTTHCPVPLGISAFRAQNTNGHDKATPLMWGSATWNIAWVKRHRRPAALPAWEAPDLLVLDMREYFQSHGGAAFRTPSNLPA
ncbi:alpha/beta-hydrolase [Paraphaeosphaeria sporulosa]|uniref:Alpha/beta-hydrolase n=1 Tax=Paraphaeosphaeria sporulosa TaxID=1460663 RepID=A0A177CCA1_9PLEO|nr:alpha/beta-hydrolase [Paraphaeosphaeria sporulosa]OAG04429.1 alpha/beta-hydrolase [Paraphaeosphaeria sporulosa]